MAELIRPIPAHPLYGASADGRIWRLAAPPANHSWGRRRKADAVFPAPMSVFRIGRFKAVRLASHPHPLLVGRLVALAWLKAPRGLPQIVRYRDGDRDNCAAENLAWGKARKRGPKAPRRAT